MNELTVEKKWTVGRCQEVVFRPCRPKANAARCVGVVLQSARKADGARVVCAMLSGTVWSSRINCGRNPSTMTDAVVAWFRRWTPTPTWCRVQRTRASTRVLRHRLLRPIASDPTNGVVLGADQRRGLRWCCSFAGHRRYQLQTIQKSSFSLPPLTPSFSSHFCKHFCKPNFRHFQFWGYVAISKFATLSLALLDLIWKMKNEIIKMTMNKRFVDVWNW